ncbi:zinc transporter ZIP11 [Planococcus citri]|uniref:zinc transporter ZIP11 n=1 Tax=Planococcus citri TaxID=170843 RepID=UPI0031F7BD20
MIENLSPIKQTVLGTLFTWGLTALGAAFVIVFNGTQRKLLDVSLGFAAGVMVAASFWSLLAPAIEMAEQSELYGKNGEFSFIPVAVGFFLGSLFVYMVDVFLADYDLTPAYLHQDSHRKFRARKNSNDDEGEAYGHSLAMEDNYNVSRRRRPTSGDSKIKVPSPEADSKQWKRMLLLIIAITVHNVPEGLAVGVGFGAVGSSPSASFASARNLAFGIGIQNFPEGLAVSLPLKAAGFSNWKSFWYGQLSGMVEPIAGMIGAILVAIASPTLPYALSFAAGAMIYVVVDDIIPEANSSGNGKLATWGCVVGFLVMMALDVGLG